MDQRLVKIKAHFTDYRDRYVIGAVGILVGGSVVYIMLKTNNSESASIQAPITVDINGNNNVVNIINEIIQNAGRNGHPGFVIFCHQNNKAYRSIREAARELDLNPRSISEYFKNDLPRVGDYTFTKLGEAVASSK